jgi:L-threonylcarbamoyladenylate synthase
MSERRAKVLRAENIEPAITALRRGDVVAIPTETVYGLAGNAFDSDAVLKIYSAKERPSFDPLIVHVAEAYKSVKALHDLKMVDQAKMNPKMIGVTNKLMDHFWPGPLTFILPKSTKIPDLVTSGLDRVGIRMPAHPLAQRILRESGLPLAAPSANRFGRISPTNANHVVEELGDRIPFIVDGGPCDIGVESTVIAIESDHILLLRPGKITAQDLEGMAKIPVIRVTEGHIKSSPGMLDSHYAPRKPMYELVDERNMQGFCESHLKSKSIGLLVTSGSGDHEIKLLKHHSKTPHSIQYLSQSSNANEAAQNLFNTMRLMDADPDIELILFTKVIHTNGLWLAIADRMKRASHSIDHV